MGRPTKGLVTSDSVTKTGQTTHTDTHTQASGSDRKLIILAYCRDSTVGLLLAAKYNGVAMTELITRTVAAAGQDIYGVLFTLDAPTEGSNTVEFSWGGFGYSGDLDYYIVSYTDVDSIGNTISARGTSSPITGTFGTNLTEGSDLIIGASGESAFVNGEELEVPQGTSVTPSFGPVIAPSVDVGEVLIHLEENVSAGAMTIETNHTDTGGFNHGSLIAAEIIGTGTAPESNATKNFFMF